MPRRAGWHLDRRLGNNEVEKRGKEYQNWSDSSLKLTLLMSPIE